MALAIPTRPKKDPGAPPPPFKKQEGQPGQFRPGDPGQFRPGGPGPFGNPQFGQPPMGMPMQPELAKRTAAIMALRHINGLRLTGEDLRKTIPILKHLHESESALLAASTRAL